MFFIQSSFLAFIAKYFYIHIVKLIKQSQVSASFKMVSKTYERRHYLHQIFTIKMHQAKIYLEMLSAASNINT